MISALLLSLAAFAAPAYDCFAGACIGAPEGSAEEQAMVDVHGTPFQRIVTSCSGVITSVNVFHVWHNPSVKILDALPGASTPTGLDGMSAAIRVYTVLGENMFLSGWKAKSESDTGMSIFWFHPAVKGVRASEIEKLGGLGDFAWTVRMVSVHPETATLCKKP